MKSTVFTSDDAANWLFTKYYYSGSNSRYWTFQMALNIILQTRKNPVIVETGCQRQKDDLGAGMSTSIFGEFCKRYSGKLYTVDLFPNHLNICKECTLDFADVIEYIESDSVAWLQNVKGVQADLLYLDSLDHPYWELLEAYGLRDNVDLAIKRLASLSHDEVLYRHGESIIPCQQHCLEELIAASKSGVVGPKTLVLIDDNQLPGGGKSRLAKDHLKRNGWTCLLDLQQSLWMSL